MSYQSKKNNKENPENNRNNVFWDDWFQNSEQTLERDKEMVLQTLEHLRNKDPESILRECEDSQ